MPGGCCRSPASGFLTAVNTSTLSVALPVVARHFQATATQANWILLSYMLVNTVLILVFGRLADIVGRRALYLAGLALLTLACLGSGLAPHRTTAFEAGLQVLTVATGMMVASPIAGRLAVRVPARIVSTAGMSLTSLALALLAVVIGPATSGALLASLLGMVGIGSGPFLAPNTSSIMSSVWQHAVSSPRCCGPVRCAVESYAV